MEISAKKDTQLTVNFVSQLTPFRPCSNDDALITNNKIIPLFIILKYN